MISVEFYKLDDRGNDVRAGKIILDADGDVEPEFDSDRLENSILDAVVLDQTGKRVTRLSDPEGWLSNLYRHYKSPYLRASRPLRS